MLKLYNLSSIPRTETTSIEDNHERVLGVILSLSNGDVRVGPCPST
jgi:hypothetical protein